MLRINKFSTFLQLLIYIPMYGVNAGLISGEKIAELRVFLRCAQFEDEKITARAQISFIPKNLPNISNVNGDEFRFVIPLNPTKLRELDWYLESYYIWPVGVFKARAENVEKSLPEWGKALYRETLGTSFAESPLQNWAECPPDCERSISIVVDLETAEFKHRAAGTHLLALPWELLHDGEGYLFARTEALRVRRQVSHARNSTQNPTSVPIRILLVSPRPEDDSCDYIDHRISAKALVDAAIELGSGAELYTLPTPTIEALRSSLTEFKANGTPIDVLHFDGHGFYDSATQISYLCFEDPADQHKAELRRPQLVQAAVFAAVLRDHKIHLVFLEACQSAAHENPAASLGVQLLEGGVPSVVAMTHSVLVETARRFVKHFYSEVAAGSRIGRAMLKGQQQLFEKKDRGSYAGGVFLNLDDWFVPVLYQQDGDPYLVEPVTPKKVTKVVREAAHFAGILAEPSHSFVGRSRELLAIERILHHNRWLVVTAPGGQGKTALATEAARWLTRVGIFESAAFVSLDTVFNQRALIDNLARQLFFPGGIFNVASFNSLAEASREFFQQLSSKRVVLVVDNCEAHLLGTSEGESNASNVSDSSIFCFFEELLKNTLATKIVFTSRKSLPDPFSDQASYVELGRLDKREAVDIAIRVATQNTPSGETLSAELREIEEMVNAVGCHARAVVLLAKESAHSGVARATSDLKQVFEELEKRFPGDRENSMFASLELSLRELPTPLKEKIWLFAPFRKGAHLNVVTRIGRISRNEAEALLWRLCEIGVAQQAGGDHYILDPSFPSYVQRRIPEYQLRSYESSWLEGMAEFTVLLYDERSHNGILASELTFLELDNLTAMLDLMVNRKWPPECIVRFAKYVEDLVADLRIAPVLQRVRRVRQHAAPRVTAWSHAQYLNLSGDVDAAFEAGDFHLALERATALLSRSLSAGSTAYDAADYDIALAHSDVGRIRLRLGHSADALRHLTKAIEMFRVLAHAGNHSAHGMLGSCLSERGDCLRALDQFGSAEADITEAINIALARNDFRSTAMYRSRLGDLQRLQKRYDEAIAAHHEAADAFRRSGDNHQLATALHKIGQIHYELLQKDAAEKLFKEALAICVQLNDPVGEANALNGLGCVYALFERYEDSLHFFLRAANTAASFGDNLAECHHRRSAANILISLKRYEEARTEIERAKVLGEPFRNASAPWITWEVLAHLEECLGDLEAANTARLKQVELYMVYRRAGGHRQSLSAHLLAIVERAFEANDFTEARNLLEFGLERKKLDAAGPLLFGKLKRIVDGERSMDLADDPGLLPLDAVDLKLFLEDLHNRSL